MTLANLSYAINKLDLTIVPTKYKYKNLYKLLHPCIDASLRTDFKKVIDVILCKAFVLYESTSKIQEINEILFTKRLLGRPKDFQDLINFKPYTRLNNNGKCVVNYEEK